jgi:hypothetical protein
VPTTPGPKVNTKSARLGPEILNLWDKGGAIAEIARSLSCGDNTVRRTVDQHRPGQRASRAAGLLVVAETKACLGCGEVKPTDSYPERPDRPGKRQARCEACLRDWRRGWQHENPERNREGVRRRRARLRKSRSQPYRDMDVYVRDNGLCWFCHEHVDPLLRYPDRKSMVVHHLHPIAKSGPDVMTNVALAHYDCNHRAKDAYDSPFIGWTVRPLPIPDARRVVIAYHYLHRACPMSYAFGLHDDLGVLRGAVAFGSPSSQRITRSVTSAEVKVLELKRLWINDDAPFSAGSFFVSRALRQLPPAIVVSYADTGVSDPRFGTAHHGGVYRACSFFYSGTSRPATEWRVPGSARNAGKAHPDSERVAVSPKARYWTTTGSARQKKMLRRDMQWPALPWST